MNGCGKYLERIGHLYPQVNLPKEHGGGKPRHSLIWARTLPCPDPAFAGVDVPIASSFCCLQKQRGLIEPIVDRQAKTISYRIIYGGTKEQHAAAKTGTKAKRGAYHCLLSGSAIEPDYVKACGRNGK